MILGDPALATRTAQTERRLAIDELFRQVAARRPGTPALIDPPNRESFTDGTPLRLTYAEADRMVWAIAGRLRRLGLPTDAIVGIQLPNTVENILTILGVLRAGLIPALLPQLWRHADAATALSRVGAKALITCRRAGGFAYAELATQIAAQVFSIRHVCAFGPNLPDGVVAFDDLFTAAKIDPVPTLERDRQGNAGAHVAVLSFEACEDGPVPVARNHLELLAGGLCVLLEGGLQQDACLLSTIPPSSFAGVCLTLLSWLLSGGTLVLHQAFDEAVLARQRREERCGTLILPAAIAFTLAETGLFAREGPTTILAAWRSPDRLGTSPDWAEQDAVLVDIPIFGEAGLIAARRQSGGRPAAIPAGPIHAPRDDGGGAMVAELVATETGALAMRGPMVPRHSFPPGVERSDRPHLVIGRGDLVDSGYSCVADTLTKTLSVTAPLSGFVNVGGYRFSLYRLLETIGHIDAGATLAALPDALIGQRLVGKAADHKAMVDALDAAGVNPIVSAAFGAAGEVDLPKALGAA
jgi:hypothetical protein